MPGCMQPAAEPHLVARVHTIRGAIAHDQVGLVALEVRDDLSCCGCTGDVPLDLDHTVHGAHRLQVNSNDLGSMRPVAVNAVSDCRAVGTDSWGCECSPCALACAQQLPTEHLAPASWCCTQVYHSVDACSAVQHRVSRACYKIARSAVRPLTLQYMVLSVDLQQLEGAAGPPALLLGHAVVDVPLVFARPPHSCCLSARRCGEHTAEKSFRGLSPWSADRADGALLILSAVVPIKRECGVGLVVFA